MLAAHRDRYSGPGRRNLRRLIWLLNQEAASGFSTTITCATGPWTVTLTSSEKTRVQSPRNRTIFNPHMRALSGAVRDGHLLKAFHSGLRPRHLLAIQFESQLCALTAR